MADLKKSEQRGSNHGKEEAEIRTRDGDWAVDEGLWGVAVVEDPCAVRGCPNRNGLAAIHGENFAVYLFLSLGLGDDDDDDDDDVLFKKLSSGRRNM